MKSGDLLTIQETNSMKGGILTSITIHLVGFLCLLGWSDDSAVPNSKKPPIRIHHVVMAKPISTPPSPPKHTPRKTVPLNAPLLVASKVPTALTPAQLDTPLLSPPKPLITTASPTKSPVANIAMKKRIPAIPFRNDRLKPKTSLQKPATQTHPELRIQPIQSENLRMTDSGRNKRSGKSLVKVSGASVHSFSIKPPSSLGNAGIRSQSAKPVPTRSYTNPNSNKLFKAKPLPVSPPQQEPVYTRASGQASRAKLRSLESSSSIISRQVHSIQPETWESPTNSKIRQAAPRISFASDTTIAPLSSKIRPIVPTSQPEARQSGPGVTVNKDQEVREAKIESSSGNPGSRDFLSGQGSTSGGLAALRGGFLRQVRQRIAKARFYPRFARRRGWEGQPVVAFTLNREGDLLKLTLKTPSGHKVLDQAALDSVKKGAPYPRIPEPLNMDSYSFILPINFVLDGS